LHNGGSKDVGSRDKPDAEMYRSAIDFLGGGDPGAVMMVAAHNSDLVHAASHGMPTAFIGRPYEHGPKQSRDFKAEHDFSFVADGLTDLADKMGALRCTAVLGREV
jgi:2-haloacid dehalogenase